MTAPASFGQKFAVQVLACIDCHECLNGRWYYPDTIWEAGKGRIPNPYQGCCRNCGSRKFIVGEFPMIHMAKWEREGWQFVPWNQPTDREIPNPFVKHNIFEVRNNHVYADR